MMYSELTQCPLLTDSSGPFGMACVYINMRYFHRDPYNLMLALCRPTNKYRRYVTQFVALGCSNIRYFIRSLFRILPRIWFISFIVSLQIHFHHDQAIWGTTLFFNSRCVYIYMHTMYNTLILGTGGLHNGRRGGGGSSQVLPLQN